MFAINSSIVHNLFFYHFNFSFLFRLTSFPCFQILTVLFATTSHYSYFIHTKRTLSAKKLVKRKSQIARRKYCHPNHAEIVDKRSVLNFHTFFYKEQSINPVLLWRQGKVFHECYVEYKGGSRCEILKKGTGLMYGSYVCVNIERRDLQGLYLTLSNIIFEHCTNYIQNHLLFTNYDVFFCEPEFCQI